MYNSSLLPEHVAGLAEKEARMATSEPGITRDCSRSIVIRMRIGMIGAGAIGTVIARHIASNDELELAAVLDLDEQALARMKRLDSNTVCITDFDDFLEQDVDLYIEAASQDAVREYGDRLLDKEDLMIMSIGALADDELKDRLYTTAKKSDRKVYLPSGAIAGVDAVKAASADAIYEAVLTTRKNPISLGRDDSEEVVVFEGSAREAAEKFPSNINVAATLGLAGIGMERTRVKIISDPGVDRNTHEIYVRGEFGELRTRTENMPSPDNPKTSYLAALSAVKTLKKIAEPFQVGT